MAGKAGGRPATGRSQLQRVLDEMNVSQAELARKTDIHPRAISGLCRGAIDPHPGQMNAIAKALKRPVLSLFDLDELERSYRAQVEAQRKRPKR